MSDCYLDNNYNNISAVSPILVTNNDTWICHLIQAANLCLIKLNTNYLRQTKIIASYNIPMEEASTLKDRVIRIILTQSW
jgi:hypothetical protein